MILTDGVQGYALYTHKALPVSHLSEPVLWCTLSPDDYLSRRRGGAENKKRNLRRWQYKIVNPEGRLKGKNIAQKSWKTSSGNWGSRRMRSSARIKSQQPKIAWGISGIPYEGYWRMPLSRCIQIPRKRWAGQIPKREWQNCLSVSKREHGWQRQHGLWRICIRKYQKILAH